MDNFDEGMEKLLAIEKSLYGMIELPRLINELKEREIKQQKIFEDLQSNINKYRTFLQNIPLRLFIKNMDLSYIYCSHSYADDLKKQPEEIIGRTDRDFFPPDMAEEFIKDDKKILEGGELENIENKYLIGGREFIVHMVKSPLRDKNGSLVGLMGLFWDVTEDKHREEEARRYHAHLEGLLSNRTDELEKTRQQLQQESSERRKVEERLKETEEIRQTIFEWTGSAIAVLNEGDMIIVQANKKLEKILGIHREEMENKRSLTDFIDDVDLDRIKNQCLAVRSGLDDLDGGREYRFVDQQGNWKDIFVTMALIPETGRITASFLDVTKNNQIRRRLSSGRRLNIV